MGRKNTQVFCEPCGKVNREEYLSKYNKSKWKKVLADPVLHAKNKLAGNKYRDKNKDAINKKKREENSTPEGKAKQKVRLDRWNRNNPGAAAKRTAEWIKNNRERHNKSARERGKRQGYPHQRKHELRKREALIKTSCDKSIKAIYKKCKAIIEETGIDHHVDHIIPLAIGGAHHQENLRIITAEENLSKNSKYDPSLGGVWADNDLAKKNRKLFSKRGKSLTVRRLAEVCWRIVRQIIGICFGSSNRHPLCYAPPCKGEAGPTSILRRLVRDQAFPGQSRSNLRFNFMGWNRSRRHEAFCTGLWM